MSNITPRRIEWTGPSGYVVVLDEDGVNLRPSGVALEECEINELLRVIDAARECRDARKAPTPVVPPRDEIRAASAKYAAERVVRLVDKALNTNLPF